MMPNYSTVKKLLRKQFATMTITRSFIDSQDLSCFSLPKNHCIPKRQALLLLATTTKGVRTGVSNRITVNRLTE